MKGLSGFYTVKIVKKQTVFCQYGKEDTIYLWS